MTPVNSLFISVKSRLFIIGIGLLALLLSAISISTLPAQTLDLQTKQAGSTPPTTPTLIEARVIKVIDGDTIILEDGSRVRLIGIDTPEIGDASHQPECYARRAADLARSLVEGKVVRLEKDTSDKDKYNRFLRYVWIGDTMVNNYLVQNGFAVSLTIPPDVRYSTKLKESENQARSGALGLWSDCPNK